MKRFGYGMLPAFFLLSIIGHFHAVGKVYSNGQYPGQHKFSVREIRWEDWRSDTLGCLGKRWTYLDSLDRSDLIGQPKDTVLKYLGAPARVERFSSEERFLVLFHKKQTIPFHLYPITSDCTTREPMVGVKIYYDKHARVLGFSRLYHP